MLDYNLKYIRSDGRTFSFNGREDVLLESISGENGYSINISTTQDYQQIGSAVGGFSVGSQTIAINGYILNNNIAKKSEMLAIFAPLTKGVLVWDDKYSLDVVISQSPIISQGKYSKFSLTLLASFPFWKSVRSNVVGTGIVYPLFSFPLNFSNPHKFGEAKVDAYFNAVNNGDVEVEFNLEILAGDTAIINPVISNVYTGEMIKINGTIPTGASVVMARNDGVLTLTQKVGDIITDIFDKLDESSNLFSLHVGDNVIGFTADTGRNLATIAISYNIAKAGVLINGS